MLALISPAKKLDFDRSSAFSNHSQPIFLKEIDDLGRTAKKLSRAKIASMMKLSDNLSKLNFNRFQALSQPFDETNARHAASVFNGDTYMGLQAKTMNDDDMEFAQNHLRILSGLYGLLRPLDLIQAYRLEMGTRFITSKGGDLYDFWDGKLSKAIDEITSSHKNPSVINLASNEYFKAVKAKQLSSPVITPVFKEVKDGETRTLGMFAKRARGMMARFMITERIQNPEDLKGFNDGGYRFQDNVSDDKTWIFTRPQPPKKS